MPNQVTTCQERGWTDPRDRKFPQRSRRNQPRLATIAGLRRACRPETSKIIFAGRISLARPQKRTITQGTQECSPLKHHIAESLITTLEVWVCVRGLRFLQFDDPASHTDRDSLRAITCPQLLHDVPDVYLDGLFRNEELFGNVPIPISASDVSKDLSLTLS